ncbi:exonuclease [Roseibium sp.]|uniref:exonuclease n=1 Tax=Roseibium sp. TaxID=1936156 RepID=UPI003B516BAD
MEKFRTATIFDCEYLTADGAMKRYWAGPIDPDPVVAQIGAVNLSLGGDYPVVGSKRIYIGPLDRNGKKQKLDPYFTDLTGISQEEMDQNGVDLAEALCQFDHFSNGGTFWSWGKDELNLLGISCFVAGVAPPIPAHRFGNAKSLMVRAGMSSEDIEMTTSGQLAQRFEIPHDNQRHHDALDDALSITLTLQHFLRGGQLSQSDFHFPNHT